MSKKTDNQRAIEKVAKILVTALLKRVADPISGGAKNSKLRRGRFRDSRRGSRDHYHC